MKEFDRKVVACIQTLCSIPHALNIHAVSQITGITLPSTFEAKVKLSETFIRLNSNNHASITGRHRWLQLPKPTETKKYNRLFHVQQLSKQLHWSFQARYTTPLPPSTSTSTRSHWYHYPSCPPTNSTKETT